ncbi:hypothetical protein Nepgr_006015 [Nepenthes gracilis]|uniref:Uncharacterized protein n=1 Tax=Nepenthes gracilis TaxID=150966 RepID=A0AAD3S4M5_NEPGR|nr:hypothetical protein Nepgr_006015 [Nepenthes gracilis]
MLQLDSSSILHRLEAPEMGSLMAGWSSPVHDPKAAKYMRNKSLTNEKIDAYWKSKKKTVDEHLQAISTTTATTIEASIIEESANIRHRRSRSLPIVNTVEDHLEREAADTDFEKLLKKICWWTKSKWAFLNEPPVLTAEGNKCASQHHVAGLAPTNADTGIAGV